MNKSYIIVKMLYELCSSKPFPKAEDIGGGITEKEYVESIELLVNKKLIKNVKLIYGGNGIVELAHNLDKAEMTRKGLEHLKANKDILKLEPIN